MAPNHLDSSVFAAILDLPPLAIGLRSACWDRSGSQRCSRSFLTMSGMTISDFTARGLRSVLQTLEKIMYSKAYNQKSSYFSSTQIWSITCSCGATAPTSLSPMSSGWCEWRSDLWSYLACGMETDRRAVAACSCARTQSSPPSRLLWALSPSSCLSAFWAAASRRC